MLVAERIAARCGAPIEPVAWNAPSVAWCAYSAVLVRSTWDYHRYAAAKRSWRSCSNDATGMRRWSSRRSTSYRTHRVRLDEVGHPVDLLSSVAADSHALLQPFMPEVGDAEWSFIFFDDGAGALAYSHAVLKRPKHGDFRVQPEFGGTVDLEEPPAGVLEAARASASILARVAPGPLLYARLDGGSPPRTLPATASRKRSRASCGRRPDHSCAIRT